MESLETAGLIIFDLDGTLIKLDVNWPLMKKELSDLFHRVYGFDSDFTPLTKVLEEVREKHGETGLKDALSIIKEHEENGLAHSHPLPALDLLKSADSSKKIAIFSTNTRHAVERALAYYNVLSRVSMIVSFEDVKETKPDPEGIEKIVSALGFAKKDVVYFGDKDVDREAGKRAGVYTKIV
ncbi:MAG: HAD-IA family hydrolase [Methanobacteriota archaeon]